MKEINALTPSYAGVTYDRIETDGIQWPCPNATHPEPNISIKTDSQGGWAFSAPLNLNPPQKSRIRSTPLL